MKMTIKTSTKAKSTSWSRTKTMIVSGVKSMSWTRSLSLSGFLSKHIFYSITRSKSWHKSWRKSHWCSFWD